MNDWCQCEHESHGSIGFIGMPHAYGVRSITAAISTAYGVFDLCRACRLDGHLTESISA